MEDTPDAAGNTGLSGSSTNAYVSVKENEDATGILGSRIGQDNMEKVKDVTHSAQNTNNVNDTASENENNTGFITSSIDQDKVEKVEDVTNGPQDTNISNVSFSVNEEGNTDLVASSIDQGDVEKDKDETLSLVSLKRKYPGGHDMKTKSDTDGSSPSENPEQQAVNEAGDESEASYKCGVCMKGFPDITKLHEHMVNDEKLKGYKFNVEDKTAYQEKTKTKTPGKKTGNKRGRKRKQGNPDEDMSSDRKSESIVVKTEVEIDDEINETSLVKFEKTIEAKGSKSAFFDPIAHGYGTRRRSYLKLKEQASPVENKRKPSKQRKIVKAHDNNEINTQDDNVINPEYVEQVDMKNVATDENVPESVALDENVPDSVASDDKLLGLVATDEHAPESEMKPDGTDYIITENAESDEVNSGEDSSDNEVSEEESDPSWTVDSPGNNGTATKKVTSLSSSGSTNDAKKFKTGQSQKSTSGKKKKGFKCKSCGKVLKSKHNASKHKTIHLLKEEEAEFEEVEVIEIKQEKIEEDIPDKNVEKAHNDNGIEKNDQNDVERLHEEYLCSKCDTVFSDKKAFKEHLMTAHRRKVHRCEICEQVFNKLYLLEDHMDMCHSKEPFECDICNAKFTNRRNLWSHKGRHLSPTDKHYTEEVARKIREEHKERMKQKVKPEMTQCTICGKDIVSKRLIRHLASHNKSKDYECDICHKRFANPRYVKDHKTKSHGNKTSTCDICGHTFKGTSYLEKHKQIHGPKDKICQICGRGFTTDFYLKVHMVTHEVFEAKEGNAENLSSWDICGDTFKGTSYLEISTQTDSWTYQICGRGFTTDFYLKVHMVTHEAEKHFKCTMCAAAFKHKARLDIHMLERHSEDHDRPCKYCGQLFPSRHKARLHERRVHEGHIPAKPSSAKRRTEMIPKVMKVQNIQGAKFNSGKAESSHVIMKIDDDSAESVEQIIEIPENSQQCQLMILPNGVIKVLNVIEGTTEQPEIRVVDEEKDDGNIMVQYLSEDGSEVIDNGDANIQYIEVDESEFNLLTQNKDSSTHIVEIVDPTQQD